MFSPQDGPALRFSSRSRAATITMLNGGASSAKFVEALPPAKRPYVSLILHDKATHAWDVTLPFPMTFEDRYSHRGAGGQSQWLTTDL
jgi:hypothetical protein